MTMPAAPAADRRWLVWGSFVVALVIGGALLGKYRLVEPVPFAAACERQEGPWLGCFTRGVLVALFVKNIAGMAAAIFGVWSTVTRQRPVAFAAVAMGGISMVLYRFDAAVVGVMLGLLVLARAAAGPQQH
ncbi:MAG: hypothetical protein RLZZ200_2190 [Pseudomonadota bacterium]|jgi:hypothetical protein